MLCHSMVAATMVMEAAVVAVQVDVSSATANCQMLMAMWMMFVAICGPFLVDNLTQCQRRQRHFVYSNSFVSMNRATDDDDADAADGRTFAAVNLMAMR